MAHVTNFVYKDAHHSPLHASPIITAAISSGGQKITWWPWEQKPQFMKIHFEVAKAIYYTHIAIIVKLLIPGFHYYYKEDKPFTLL